MSKLKYANGNKPLTEEQKQQMIKEAAEHYGKYMDALKIDWRNDPNSSDTPMRVAKAFVNDLAEGCYNKGPKITAFDNLDEYDGMVFQGNIKVNSFCSHHHLPFIGNAHVAYIPTTKSKIIGLSKLNRTVEFFARRPQVQENLTRKSKNQKNGKSFAGTVWSRDTRTQGLPATSSAHARIAQACAETFGAHADKREAN